MYILRRKTNFANLPTFILLFSRILHILVYLIILIIYIQPKYTVQEYTHILSQEFVKECGNEIFFIYSFIHHLFSLIILINFCTPKNHHKERGRMDGEQKPKKNNYILPSFEQSVLSCDGPRNQNHYLMSCRSKDCIFFGCLTIISVQSISIDQI